MATGMEWLQKQKKADLSDIASRVGLTSYDKLKKTELEVALEQHLRTNASRLSSDSTVAPFYQGADPASPVKHKGGKIVGGGKTDDEKEKKKPRRQTLKASGDDAPTSSTSTTTPSRAVSNLAARVPLPASPAALANRIDASTSSLRRSLSRFTTSPRLKRYTHQTRAALSSATALTNLCLFVELFFLLTTVLPLKYAFSTPPVPAVGLGAVAVKLPDLFALLTLAFWGPVLTWASLLVAVPAGAGWVFNFKGERRARVDVVSFNVAKAGVVWLAIVRGGWGGEAIEVLKKALPGGVQGLFVGSATGALAGVYESVLHGGRK